MSAIYGNNGEICNDILHKLIKTSQLMVSFVIKNCSWYQIIIFSSILRDDSMKCLVVPKTCLYQVVTFPCSRFIKIYCCDAWFVSKKIYSFTRWNLFILVIQPFTKLLKGNLVYIVLCRYKRKGRPQYTLTSIDASALTSSPVIHFVQIRLLLIHLNLVRNGKETV